MIDGALDLAAREPSACGDYGLSDGKSIGYLRISPIHTIERYEVAHFVAYGDAHNHVELPRLCDCSIHDRVCFGQSQRHDMLGQRINIIGRSRAHLKFLGNYTNSRRYSVPASSRSYAGVLGIADNGAVMDVAGRDQEADRAAFRIDPRVDLGGEASSALAHTRSPLFFGPEAC